MGRKNLANSTNSRYYYHNDKWQVTAAYGISDSVTTFLYGNYVDEVLRMTNSSGTYYYGHDQLYSPVVIVNSSGSIEDRYEYDAYGACRVLNADFTADSDGRPDCGNPYLFTGREVDYLDSGSRPLQYNRHRYYLQGLGRWTSEDPLGIDPSGAPRRSRLHVYRQFADGALLYKYASGNPVTKVDPDGMACTVFFNCHLTSTYTIGKCDRQCEYICIETSRWDSGYYGQGTCDDLPPGPIVINDGFRIAGSLLCKLTGGRCGKKAGDCPNPTETQRIFNLTGC